MSEHGASMGASSRSAVELPKRPVEKFVLDNGLTVIVREDSSSAVVSLQGWCQTGSIHEAGWMGAGLSHILEHMLFKGTEARGPEQVAREVGGMGGQINAYTSFDRTVYYIDCPSESSAGCLDVLMDVVARATIPADEFATEQEVIRREFAMLGDDPDRVASQAMFATAFRTHPYGVPVIGYREVFDRLDRQDVLDYYHERYAPNNLFFVIAGDVNAAAVREQMETFFAEIPRRRLAPCYVPQEPGQLGRRDAFRAFSTPVSKLWLAWRIPGITHEDMPALDLLAMALGDGRSSRLYRKVREERGSVHSIGAFSYTPADGGLLAIGADVDPDMREAAEADIFTELARVVDDGISAEEIDKARNMALAGQIGTLVSTQGQASDLGGNWLAARNLDFTRDYLRRLGTVSADDVIEVARRYLVDDGLSVTEVGPERSSQPSVRSSASHQAASEVHELSNGLQLVVQPDKRLPLVSMCTAFRAGLLEEDAAHSGASALLASSLFQGTTERSAAQLADAIESCGGSANAGAGNNSLFVNACVMTPQFDLALEMSAEVIMKPALALESVDREREVQIAAIAEELERPMGVAMKLVKQKLFRDHPFARNRSGEIENLQKLTPEALRAMKDRLLVARNGVVSVCGDVDPSAVRDTVEGYLAGLESGELAAVDPPQPQWPEEAVQADHQLDKEQAVVVVALPGIDLASPDRPAIDLIDEVLSGMDGRLFSRIREELGLAYYTGSSQLIGLSRGALLAYVGTRPDAAAEAQDELLNELEKLASGGVTEDELLHAKRSYEGKHRIGKQSPGARAQAAALDQLYGLGADHSDKLQAAVGSLTAKDVAEVASRYFSPDVARVCVQVKP